MSLRGGIFDGAQSEQTMTWVDPVLGARIRKNLTDKWYLTAYGDYGGFDVGSEFTWQLYGGVGYDFNSRVTAFLTYRYLVVDYQNDSKVWDVQMQGPVIGVAIAL
jgi:predicted porin